MSTVERIDLTPLQLMSLTGVLLLAFAASLGMAFNLGGFIVNGWFVVGCVFVGAAFGYPALRQADAQRRASMRLEPAGA